MRLLVVGGTVFVGRAVVEAALARGWDVTVLHRGAHGEDAVPPGVAHLHGDRRSAESVAAAVAGSAGVAGGWDAVVDTCGFVAGDVAAVTEVLGDDVGWYGFVSSVSAHPDWPAVAVGSASRVFAEDAPAGYGADKARAERAVLAAYGERALVARPALIVGPYENIGRLPYWLRRVARGGEVLAPGAPDEPRQWVDARDLAEWMLSLAESGRGGVHDVVGPVGQFTMGELLAECRAVTGGAASITWVDGERIVAAGIAPWTELPIWMWDATEPVGGTWQVDASSAYGCGFVARPVAETVADTWAWLSAGGSLGAYRSEYAVRDLDPAREAAVLAAVRAE